VRPRVDEVTRFPRAVVGYPDRAAGWVRNDSMAPLVLDYDVGMESIAATGGR